MNRRDFLVNLTVVSGGGVLACGAGSHLLPTVGPATAPPPADVAWGKAPCRYCGTGCGVEVGVRAGEVVAVRGDEASPVNRGLLCTKGYNLPELLYGADRLTRPLRRDPDGGGFSPVSWDEALDTIARHFTAALRDHGPGSVGVFGSGQWTVFDGYAMVKWVKGGMRGNNLESNSRLCMASAVSGFMSQFQSDEPMGCYDDLDVGSDFVLWGSNMAEAHPVLFNRILDNKHHNPGVRIVAIDPRQTTTTDLADLHLPVNPGSDLMLANGVLHLLLARGQVNESFVRDNLVFKRGEEDPVRIGYGCFGGQADHYDFADVPRDSTLDELRAFLDDYAPDRVARTTGLTEAQVTALADLYGDAGRGTVSLWTMGINQHVRGTWANNAITNLHLMTGKIGRPGNNPMSLTGQPSACGTSREVGIAQNRLPADMVVTNPAHRLRVERAWGLPEGTISAKPGLHAVDMFRAVGRGELKALWIQASNPYVTLPNLERFERRPGDGLFLVASDIYPTETTRRADIVLPSAAWVEREGVYGNAERRTQHWEKMIDPPGEAREDAWQVIQVARRMGMGGLFPWPEDAWHEPMYEEYRSLTLGTGKDVASYSQLRASRGLRWPVVDGQETRYRYAAGHDPYVKRGAVHFYKATDHGQRAAVSARPYHPPAESPDAEYPFWLSTGRVLEHWHTGTMTRRTRQLYQAVPAAYVEMHRDDARALGVVGGEPVRLVTRRGRLELPALIGGRGRPRRGSVFVPFHFEAALINRLTLDAMDNISKEPDFKKCAVRIERIS